MARTGEGEGASTMTSISPLGATAPQKGDTLTRALENPRPDAENDAGSLASVARWLPATSETRSLGELLLRGLPPRVAPSAVHAEGEPARGLRGRGRHKAWPPGAGMSIGEKRQWNQRAAQRYGRHG